MIEIKWYMIFMCILVGSVLVSEVLETQSKHQCAVAGMTAGLDATAIERICGKKK